MTNTLDSASTRLIVEEVFDMRSIDSICHFRASVWRGVAGVAPNAFPGGQWRDAFDDVAHHWIVRTDDGRMIGSARLTIHDLLDAAPESFQYERYGLQLSGPIAAPDRVVVCPTARRRGAAKLLLDAQDAVAIEAGAHWAVRQASPAMSRLIQRRGWRLLGPALPDRRFPGVPFTVSVNSYQDELITGRDR